MSRLIITNGDSAAQRIDALGHADFVLPWRDVLHEGPVLPCDSLRKQSVGRAAFIAGFADMPEPDVARDFIQRDDVFLQAVGEDETHIELWFEHDLYDQLQLMQILDVLYRQFPIKDVYLVQADFYLAEIANVDFRILPQQAVKITASQKEYGAKAWQAFCAPDPKAIENFLAHDGVLPFVHKALQRVLREYPDAETGLPLSLSYALSLLREKGTAKIKEMFHHMQQCEEAKFMGDLSFARLMDTLISLTEPVVCAVDKSLLKLEKNTYPAFFEQTVMLSSFGGKLLDGEERSLDFPSDQRWIGGVQLSGDNMYLFDRKLDKIVHKVG
ncbi:MAG: hypothetical protein ACNI26_12155 [Terasakiella sp.]|uniref:hypothetical protein n=1 Tax=unclassified Terasakiella TaxID=2614952 RepID=UPI003B00B047